MKFISISLVFLLMNGYHSTRPAVVKATTAVNENTQSNKDGWQTLFDGKTTKGWHTYGKTTVGDAWKVADGAVYVDPSVKEGGDLERLRMARL